MEWKKLVVTAALGLAVVGCGDGSTPAPTPTATTAPAAGDVKAEAEKLLTDAMTYAKDHKWELADKAVTQLEGLKSKLPAEYGPKIDQLKTTIASLKSAGAASMPAIPARP